MTPSGTRAGTRTGTRSWVEHHMGMPISITLRGPRLDAPDVEAAVAAAYAELAECDRVCSLWKPDSPLSRLRRGEVDSASIIAEHPAVGEVFAFCEEASRRTNGAFTWLWPGPDGELLIEPTGLVKGWAIGRAGAILAAVPGHAYCVNAGGDIAVGGADATPGADRPWKLGIEDPSDRTRIAHVVEIRTGGMATSGTAARGAHLLDPSTGQPVRRGGSVTVVGPSIMWADVWATALFVGPAALEDDLTSELGWHVVRLAGEYDEGTAPVVPAGVAADHLGTSESA